jgi:regulator of G-protein signaling
MRRHPKKSQKMLSKSSAGSEEGDVNTMKKPLIAKWKPGAKLQVTNRAQNDGTRLSFIRRLNIFLLLLLFSLTESLLEGLKRAQRSRLEDQRGTEINFELPEFLKDKEKYANIGNKLRKTKFDESPSNSVSLYNNVDPCNNNGPIKMNTSPPHYTQKPPQPAPRLSLTGKSPTKSSPESSSVQSKISSLEKMMGSTGKVYTNSRSNTPIDLNLNLSTQCLPSNTPMKTRRSSDSPIYYSPDTSSSGIYAGKIRTNNASFIFRHSYLFFTDTSMVFNHHPNSSYESTNMGYYNNNGNDYQEIEDANRNRAFKQDEDQQVPPLPPKPTKLPIKPSNWQTTSNNKENFFKTPRAPLASAEPSTTKKSDMYLEKPTSSFV